jgi:hypothetical protein
MLERRRVTEMANAAAATWVVFPNSPMITILFVTTKSFPVDESNTILRRGLLTYDINRGTNSNKVPKACHQLSYLTFVLEVHRFEYAIITK